MEFSKTIALATLLINCILLVVVYPFLNKRNKNAVAKTLGICVPAASIGVTVIATRNKTGISNYFIVANCMLVVLIIANAIIAIKNNREKESKMIMLIANISLVLDLLMIFSAS